MLSEWLKDMCFDQRSDGAIPYVVPHALDDMSYGSALWGDAVTIVPWNLYLQYGDISILQRMYAAMKAWLHFISTQSQGYLWVDGTHFGDWLALDGKGDECSGRTDHILIATAFSAYSTWIVSRTAALLKKDKDAQFYKSLYLNIVRAYRREFITPTGRLAIDTQTAHVLTLHFNLAEEVHRPRIVRNLVKLIEDSNNSLTTGLAGVSYLCPVLSAFGEHELAGRLLLRTEFPSWLYQVKKGATTIWERWDGIRPDGSLQAKSMNSFNHYVFGSIYDWLLRCLAGIDMIKPAYGEVLLHPRLVDGISFVSAWLKTRDGVVRIYTRAESNSRVIDCVIPAGAIAMLIIENSEIKSVLESGKKLMISQGIKRFWQSGDDVCVSLQSGEFSFTVVDDI
jgi:alpha-L-rhamnosidase